MSYKTNLGLAYHMGYEDALARKMPDADKVAVLLPDVADGAGEYICGTDGHEGHWLTGEEIVRCRDCERFTANDEFWIKHPSVPFPIIGATSDSCDFWAGTKCKVTPDGFCKWGKRREDK